MTSRFEVWLGSSALSSLHEDIYIRDIQYTPASIQDTTQAYGGRDGQFLTRRYVGSAEVKVVLEIHSYSTRTRHEVCEQVAAWAMKGGYLKTSDRPERRLKVVCETPPSIESALKWTDPVEIEFIAYGLPYWEDARSQKITLTGTSASGTMKGTGYASRPFVTAEITVTGSALTEITLSAGNTSITLQGIALAQNGILRLFYDDANILHITANNASLMAYRTASSSDDLRLEFGANTVSVAADVAVQAKFEARGLYL